MPYLSAAQRNLLAPPAGHPRNGMPVPTSDQQPFVLAPAWAWALCGEYTNIDDLYSAPAVYGSDDGALVFNAQRVPVGLNSEFFAITDEVFPQTVPYHRVLANNFANAVAGNLAAQDACRLALVQLTAVLNGHTVLPPDASAVYTMVMNSASWYGWDHWAIGIQGPGGGAATTYQQKVAGTPLQYNCGAVWDEAMPLQTVIQLDGLLQQQVDMLNNVV